MIGKKMEEALNDQVKEELFSAYLYLAMAAYFSHEGWDRMASWMRIQAEEELGHALRILDHVLERGGKVALQALPAPEGTWTSPLEAFQAAYKHEGHITGRIHALVELAQKEKDPAAGAMLQWFVTEQVEEEAQALKVVQLLERVGGDPRGLVMADRELGQRKKEE